MKNSYLLFDIGGTKMRLALSDGQRFRKPLVAKTPRNFSNGITQFKEYATRCIEDEKITAAIGGIRGSLDRKKNRIYDQYSLTSWSGKPLRQKLQKALRVPVYLENDADLAGLGEAVYGAGKGKPIVAYLTISTGVGGVRVVNEQIDQNTMGFEPGKQIIDVQRLETLEAYVSGQGIKKRYRKNPQKITSHKIWNEVARNLAVGIHNTVRHWSPDAVILGGGVMQSLKIELVKRHVKKLLRSFPQAPKIKRARLGELSGLYGAMALCKIKN